MANIHPLTKYREENNLTQEGLARLIGTTNASISRWEAGKRCPRQKALKKIVEHTGISPHHLIFLEQEAAE